MSRIKGLRVFRSSVAGYGLQTTRRFKAGSVVADVEGVLWREGEQRDDRHSLLLEDGVFFDMVDQTRWINHSCEPNLVVEAGVTRRGTGWAQIQALRDLEAGEEVFFDYGFPEHLKERCACASPACRGWIVESTEPEPEFAQRPAARASPRRRVA